MGDLTGQKCVLFRKKASIWTFIPLIVVYKRLQTKVIDYHTTNCFNPFHICITREVQRKQFIAPDPYYFLPN